MSDAWLVQPWPWWAAGLAVGVYIVALAALTGRPLGISTGLSRCCGLVSRAGYFHTGGSADPWRGWFLLGLPLGGLIAALGAGSLAIEPALGATTAPMATTAIPPWVLLAVGGVAIGFGSRWAGGCTSGHGMVGTAIGARSSWVATMAFMGAAVAVTQLWLWLGGAR